MPKFPKTESEIVAFAQTMIAGLTAHAADFPSITPAALQTALSGYTSSRDNQDNAKAIAQVATVSKEEAMEDLITIMKNNIRAAQIDTTSNPTKLTEIGWGPKADPTPISSPAAPSGLQSFYEGPGSLTLTWTKPANDPSRPVANYVIQRRDQIAVGSEFTDWKLADMSYQTEIKLIGQPRGLQLEYRIIATNAAGNSMPSNASPVVL
jgi:hypothetical protein